MPQIPRDSSWFLKAPVTMLDDQSTWLGYSRIDGDESPPSVHFRATSTKGALDAITRVPSLTDREKNSKATIQPRKIRVNALNPGMVETEGTHTGGMIGSHLEKALNEQALLARTGKVGDIAPIAVFLASDDLGSPASTFLLPVGIR